MKRKKFVGCFVLGLLCICVFLGWMYFQDLANTPVTLPFFDSEYPVETQDTTGEENAAYYRSVYEKGKQINEDYRGTIFFENGLINQPFVQGKDNNEYLRMNWQTGEYDEAGTVFIDYENTGNDQNTILYGHYAYPSYDPSRTMMFTPLSQLLDASNYNDNCVLYLLLENEIREYRIAAVYLADLSCDSFSCYSSDELQYNMTSYTETYFEQYHSAVKERMLYDTGIDFSYEDKLLTLQTCVENREDQREIVICKQVNSYPITDTCSFPQRKLSPSSQ